MKDIRDVPITVLKALEPFLSIKSELYKLKQHPDLFLNFEGSETLSDCYFRVNDYKAENGKFVVSITHKPQSEHVVNERSYKVPIDAINAHVEKWKGYLTERKRLQEVFSINKRLEDITEEFFQQSPYSSDDFDNEYFSILEATQLSDVCVQLIEYIEINDSVKNKIEIIEEINSLEENAIQESKRKLAQRLAKIKALMVKNGPKVLKAVADIGVNVAGNVIAKMITG